MRIEPIPFAEMTDEQRSQIEAAYASGQWRQSPVPGVMAYSSAAFRAMSASVNALFRQGVIEPRLQELLRLRSAMGKCGPCAQSRKEPSVTEEDVACLIDPQMQGMTHRERLAISFYDRLSDDYETLDEAFFIELAAEFSTAEIVELGWRCATMLGSHRFFHSLDLLTEGPATLPFDPAQIDRVTVPDAVKAA